MVEIVVYTKMMCPYCHRAKQLLKSKGASFEEIDITFDGKKRAEMVERSDGRTTVPQIFIGDVHIGGCDDLYDLEEAGGLDPLLQGVTA